MGSDSLFPFLTRNASPSPTFRPLCPWPAGCRTRFGESGLVVTRTSAGSTASWYFEASMGGATFRGEGSTPGSAEISCYAGFQAASTVRAAA